MGTLSQYCLAKQFAFADLLRFGVPLIASQTPPAIGIRVLQSRHKQEFARDTHPTIISFNRESFLAQKYRRINRQRALRRNPRSD